MTDNYEALRGALEAGPEPGRWEKTTPSSTNIYSHSGYLVAVVKRWNDSNYIAAANPETIRALLAERDALVDTANDQARANDLLSEREAGLLAQHERDSATLRRYAQQRDDLRKERDALRESLRWTAAVLQDAAGSPYCVDESGVFAIEGESRTMTQILDAADAALAQHQGEKHGRPASEPQG